MRHTFDRIMLHALLAIVLAVPTAAQAQRPFTTSNLGNWGLSNYGPESQVAPGQSYTDAFVTSSTFNVVTSTQFPPGPGEFGGLKNADYQITFAAYDANLIPNWNGTDIIGQAILSDGVTSADDRLNMPGPILNMAGQLVATSQAALWSGTIQNPIDYDENGILNDPAYVWTGSNPDGTTTAATANSWVNPYLVGGATVGLLSATNSSWIDAANVDASSSLQFYGLLPQVATNYFTTSNGQYGSAAVGIGRGQTATVGTIPAPGGPVPYYHNVPGLEHVSFPSVSTAGTLTGGYQWYTDPATLHADFGSAYNALNFILAGQNADGSFSAGHGAQVWSLANTSTFNGAATVSLDYSPLLVGSASPSQFQIYNYVGDTWVPVANQSVDVADHIITFSTNNFGLFILGVPEPSSIVLAVGALAVLLARAARRWASN
jgi:hypothetical protein